MIVETSSRVSTMWPSFLALTHHDNDLYYYYYTYIMYSHEYTLYVAANTLSGYMQRTVVSTVLDPQN